MTNEFSTKIRILIVDDSEVIRLILKEIFNREPDMEVVGEASNGQEAVQQFEKLNPDLVTMDIRMPIMNGFEATKKILSIRPVPILVVSASISDDDTHVAFQALDSGALAVVEKPQIISDSNFHLIGKNLVDAVRNLSDIKPFPRTGSNKKAKKNWFDEKPFKFPHYDIVGLGASTGGPQTLQAILSQLPEKFPIPVVIVQHIAVGFMRGLVKWLQESSPLELKIADHEEVLKPSVVYFAPDAQHLSVERRSGILVAIHSLLPEGMRFRPSIDVLFRSLADVCPQKAIAGLLTGMGNDGSAGLLAMRQKKCRTFVQDKQSCAIFGMPYYALSHGAAEKMVALDNIADFLVELVEGSTV